MENRSALVAQIEEELKTYLTGVVNLSEDNDFSQPKLVRRISLFESKTYPSGKFDADGNYKYWFDIISPRIASEVKNIDFDTKDVKVTSDRKIDALPCLIVNLKLKDYLRKNGQAEEINEDIEEGSGWGNVVWKKVKKSYERMDLRNLYVINQTVRSLDETPVIERHQLSQSDLRSRAGSWKNVQETLDGCKMNAYKATLETPTSETTVPYYEVFERNGEVKLSDLKEAQNIKPADGESNKYVFAKVIVSATTGSTAGLEVKYIMFAQAIPGKSNKDIYKEYHRGPYKGRWMREGIYELLFDLQVRANQIGNQIAQGLEWASKTIFKTNDKLIVQNVLSDLRNGDIIKTGSLDQVPVRMEGLDQLIAEWNTIIKLANELANTNEIVMGDAMPSTTAFRMVAMLNQNANKLFDFIREKLALPFGEMFEEWIVPGLIKTLTLQDVLSLTGDSDMMDRVYQLIVDDWYLRNMAAIGPHTSDMADTIKALKTDDLKKRPQLLMSEFQKLFEDFKPHCTIDITGERANLDADITTLSNLAQLEADPVRRQAIIELIARKKGVDFGSLPKSDPQSLQPAPTGAPAKEVLPASPAPQRQPVPQRSKQLVAP